MRDGERAERRVGVYGATVMPAAPAESGTGRAISRADSANLRAYRNDRPDSRRNTPQFASDFRCLSHGDGSG